MYRLVWKQDGMEQNRTERNGDGGKMSSVGNKEEEEGDGDVIILCSTDVERVVLGEYTKHETERLVPFRSVQFHVPNDTKDSISHVT
ncbi:hypothetical protein DVH24_002772 [Malus domestica]|uniref:Uncharacterized protein n=1 Tax=Malus domestica TaxID=3750 RepID=A0A498K8Q7_MALDO|nr:hypothetical protein DVH24_002772 [Malus domestica]